MVMKILVVYATRHGATQGIAERIAATLETDGLDVTLRPVASVDAVDGYDAYVIGSAAYMGGWLKEATRFVRHNHDFLVGHPIWLFSSGPVGDEVPGKEGIDPLKASEPREFAELARTMPARDQHVFYGAYDPDLSPGSFLERLSRVIPAVKDALPAGDFRDWPAIEAWAHGIAKELTKEREVELAHA
jgi:menaquinone-dependent protoporphyrinogen oxidase